MRDTRIGGMRTRGSLVPGCGGSILRIQVGVRPKLEKISNGGGSTEATFGMGDPPRTPEPTVGCCLLVGRVRCVPVFNSFSALLDSSRVQDPNPLKHFRLAFDTTKPMLVCSCSTNPQDQGIEFGFLHHDTRGSTVRRRHPRGVI